ncbi:sensor histidine kinase [Streptomyces hoynatensis]|uniref:histidine kinase n=1 Tax=Streptomyces hoynatensis TaxID=1141874 RepID=A0A3A9YPH4_9ACTN|nr:sensor histidine kinase [Streptomyces hoynatensis]RKN37076.1 sensor histidine kinase [Streptomyces hoynatensis]
MTGRFVQAFRWDRAALLALTGLLVEVGLLLFHRGDGGFARPLAGLAAAVCGCLLLGLRHRRPVTVAVLVMLLAFVYYPVSTLDGPLALVVYLVALYHLARTGRLAAAIAMAAATMLAVTAGELLQTGNHRNVDNIAILLFGGWFLSLIALGHALHIRQQHQSEAEERALAAERERDLRAAQSATEERLRLARELHDVIGHSMSLINVQATAALHRSRKRPGETAELIHALEAVRESSKEALRELRATLGVLRQVDETAPVEPVAGLERLPELAGRARATGLDLAVATTGEAPVLPPQISLAAYRIVQESLTNITRHAQAEHAVVRVEYTAGEVHLSITDDGLGARHGATGSGLAGMAARARALGGELTACNALGGGFRVTARLPLPANDALPQPHRLFG